MSGQKKGFVVVQFRLLPSQMDALRAEAMRRAEARGNLQPDASEIVREAVAEWLAERAKQQPPD